MGRLSTRAAGLAGIIFVVLVAAPGFASGSPPDPSDSAQKFLTYFQDNRSAIILASVLGVAADIFVVFFIGGLVTALRRRGADPALLVASVVALVLTGASANVGGAMSAAAAFRLNTGQHVSAETIQLVNDAGAMAFTLLGMTLAAFLLSTGMLLVRTRPFPAWIGYAGCVFAVLEVIGAFAVFTTSGFFAFGSALGLLFGLLPFGLFTLATSIVMITRGDALDAPAPAVVGTSTPAASAAMV